MGRRAKKVVNYDDDQYMPDASTHQVPDTPAMLKTLKTESHGQSPAALTGIEVKTKFPVARIKRIMQADEDVGKVAQVTPVVVSKALELFMISLVTKAATEAKSKGSKRVTALHLKQAVTKEPKFDFLSEIVGRVADAPAPSEKNEDDGDAPEGGKKKRGGGRKKRKDSEDL